MTTRPQSRERRERAVALRADGRTYREIGEALGCTYQRAQQLCKPPRDTSGPRVTWTGTLEDYLAERVRAVEVCRESIRHSLLIEACE